MVFAVALAGCGGGGGGGGGSDAASASTGSDSFAPDLGTYEPGLDIPAPSAIEKAALPVELGEWEDNMITYGKKWGEFIGDSSNKTSQRRDAVYYDAQWVFQQIAEYTGQSEPWLTYARRAEQVYRDGYLAPNNFKVPGYWRFPHGLLGDYLAKGDTTIEQIRKVRDNPAFSDPDTSSFSWKWHHAMYAREVAYGLMAQVT
ncbi:MAG: hypothetical protein M0R77_14215, partial [Gammaproteobacteria bacterium]|nr:hypothetical protein [Gammaproteobacteria bacterium]